MARNPHKFHYIYKITCLKNNRYYIGMHSTSNLDDGYLGGGKIIKNSVKKHGKEAHRKEILEYLDNRELLKEREKEIINLDLLGDPMCMNIQPGGGGGIVNEHHLKKFCEAGNKEFKKRLEDPDYRNKFVEKARRATIEKPRGFILEPEKCGKGFSSGYKHNNLSKEKMKESHLGDKNSQFNKHWIFNEELGTKRVGLDELDNYLKEGWVRGKKKKVGSKRCWIYHKEHKPKKIQLSLLYKYVADGWGLKNFSS
jgi:hypothetical protein